MFSPVRNRSEIWGFPVAPLSHPDLGNSTVSLQLVLGSQFRANWVARSSRICMDLIPPVTKVVATFI